MLLSMFVGLVISWLITWHQPPWLSYLHRHPGRMVTFMLLVTLVIPVIGGAIIIMTTRDLQQETIIITETVRDSIIAVGTAASPMFTDTVDYGGRPELSASPSCWYVIEGEDGALELKTIPVPPNSITTAHSTDASQAKLIVMREVGWRYECAIMAVGWPVRWRWLSPTEINRVVEATIVLPVTTAPAGR